MMKSLYSGVSGLKVHNTRMDVIGNNISNVNTTAYKASTVTFRDIFYQTKQQSSTGTNTRGGVNPKQVGYGAKNGSINQVMTQSGFTFSDSVYDCALQGDGFFQVMDEGGNIYYTRNGLFTVDNYGNLTDSNGYIVLGVSGDPTGMGPSTQRINLYVPPVQNNQASVSKEIDGYTVTISAAGFGPEGNISVTFTQSDVPYASLNGKNLNVQLDMREINNVYNGTTLVRTADEEFQARINEAIQVGGINLPDNVIPITIEFDATPMMEDPNNMGQNPPVMVPDVNPQVAYNTLPISDTVGSLIFTADTPGIAANSFEINMTTTSVAGAGVSAKWVGNVLTITLPENYTASSVDTITAIQNAITVAAKGDADKMITVTPGLGDATAIPPIVAFQGFAVPASDVFDGKTLRTSLANGKDNFFAEMAKGMATMPLSGGRYAGDQTTADLTLIFIDSTGVIYGEHPVHGRMMMGRIDIATFENPIGLDQVGTSYWKASLASGVPEVKNAAQDGSAEIVSGALEMSNVDIAQEFSDMIITQRGFQANSRIITVSDTMLEELINLKR